MNPLLTEALRSATVICYFTVATLALARATFLCRDGERFSDRWWLIVGIGLASRSGRR